MKSKVDQIYINTFVPVSFGFKKLSDVVGNNVIKKTVNNGLVKKVNAIQATDNNTKFGEIEKIMLNILLGKNLIRWRKIIFQQD